MKTYKYGLLAPTLNADLVGQEMLKSHRYQNQMIEILNWQRDEYRAIDSTAGNVSSFEKDLEEKTAIYSSLDEQAKKANSDARAKVLNKELSEKKKCAKIEMKNSADKLKSARKLIAKNSSIVDAKKLIRRQSLDKVKKLHSDKDIAPYSGSYMLAEEAANAANSKMPPYDGTKPNNIQFRRYSGEGRIGIAQFQPHEDLSKVISINPKSTQVQIVPLPPSVKKDGTQRKVGVKNLKLLRVRIGTVKGKAAPIWAEFPIVYHRPMQGAIAKIQILKSKIGPRDVWTASITCEHIIEKKHSLTGVVAIDLGWREYSDRVAVATWHDSFGQKGEICISNEEDSKYGLLQRLRYNNQLKSTRDKEGDKAFAKLRSFLIEKSGILPELIILETKNVQKWKSKARISNLLKKWKDNRFSGDEEVLGEPGFWDKKTKMVSGGSGLLGWNYHDFHLWNMQTSFSEKVVNCRKEFYRTEAVKLAKKYGAVVFENINGANLAKGKVGSTNRQLVAAFEFRSTCEMIFKSRGLKFEKVCAKNTSKICNSCNHKNEKSSELHLTCANCLVEYQRDENASKNILDRYLLKVESEQLGDDENQGVARISEITNDISTLEPEASLE